MLRRLGGAVRHQRTRQEARHRVDQHRAAAALQFAAPRIRPTIAWPTTSAS